MIYSKAKETRQGPGTEDEPLLVVVSNKTKNNYEVWPSGGLFEVRYSTKRQVPPQLQGKFTSLIFAKREIDRVENSKNYVTQSVRREEWDKERESWDKDSAKKHKPKTANKLRKGSDN